MAKLMSESLTFFRCCTSNGQCQPKDGIGKQSPIAKKSTGRDKRDKEDPLNERLLMICSLFPVCYVLPKWISSEIYTINPIIFRKVRKSSEN